MDTFSPERYACVSTNEEMHNLYLQQLEMALTKWLGWGTGSQRFKDMKCWLESTDFFSAPASTRYHESYSGGLVKHSLIVATQVEQLFESPVFADTSVFEAQAVFCALVHDVCKVNYYESYRKNVKDEATGQWNSVEAWKVRSDRGLYVGHGERSGMMILRLVPEITDEMLMAIRWHMGLWDCSEPGQGDFGEACRRYKMVHLLQFSDLLSVTRF